MPKEEREVPLLAGNRGSGKPSMPLAGVLILLLMAGMICAILMAGGSFLFSSEIRAALGLAKPISSAAAQQPANVNVESTLQALVLTQTALAPSSSTSSSNVQSPTSIVEITSTPLGIHNPTGVVQSDKPISVDGFALSFREIFSANGWGVQAQPNIGIKLSVKNIGDRNRVFRYTGDSLTLRDDIGNIYPIDTPDGRNQGCATTWHDILQINIDVSKDATLSSATSIHGCWYYENSSIPQFTGPMPPQAKSFFIGFKDFGPFTGFEIEVKP